MKTTKELENEIKKLKKALKSVLPYAQQEAASLADVDEPELADKAWNIIHKANQLLNEI